MLRGARSKPSCGDRRGSSAWWSAPTTLTNSM
jgi:hypothetical protein